MSRSPSSYTPPHWPKNIRYLTTQKYHSSVSKDILDIIKGQRLPDSHGHIKPQSSFIVIRKITGPSNHPAVGQFGLFAAKKIPLRTYLLDYLGEVHCDDRPSSDYDLSLYRAPDGSVSVGVDASAMGNEGRFINDYRGICGKPNAQFEERRGDNGELRMSIWTGGEAIKKGEEILVSYGKSWWSHRRPPESSSSSSSS
ncbi:SET domain protein [Thelephora terrestris]|uniref:SET domain protein n=1 Tax=Thelephora terrestris TaxID=56493 RepID=A0A9P6L7W0_9AGAM|nr:SET domain protein [Thelephora terrestris]